MKAIIIGATGATGRELVKNLLNDEFFIEIIVLNRRSFFENHPKLTEHIIDFDKMENYKELIKADVAFSCMGTTLKIAGSKENQWKVDHDYQLKFAEICHENNVPSFVLLSAMNSNSNSKMFYSRMKGELKDKISEIKFDQLIILQPSLIVRPNTDRKAEKFAEIILKSLNKVNLLNNFKPIGTDDLSKAMIQSYKSYGKGFHRVKLKDIFQLIKT